LGDTGVAHRQDSLGDSKNDARMTANRLG
jgi:hypothetical protein